MSFHRENIVWQSPDLKWNIGFYECIEAPVWERDEDYDPEWDVDYNMDAFEWVSCGHRTSDDAIAAWKGSNPGSSWVVPFAAGDERAVAEIEKLDDMAWVFLHPEQAAERAKLKEAQEVAEVSDVFLNELRARRSVEGVQVRTDIKHGEWFHSQQGALVRRGEWFGFRELGFSGQPETFTPIVSADLGSIHDSVGRVVVIDSRR